MSTQIVLSIDAMGGDRAPEVVVQGVRIAHKRHPTVRFLLHGDETRLNGLLDASPELRDCCSVHHAADVIGPDVKASQAVRQGRESSMWRAVAAVREGAAAAAVSAGNTGALMAIAKLNLKTLPGVTRPAIASIAPTLRGETVMLDLGANSECSAKHLVEFAIMGEVFARTVLGLKEPSVGLLNIGSEELKGREEIREAAQILKEGDLPIQFKGFIEGNDIGAGTVDVVVMDGFTGNAVLKTMEGTARVVSRFFKDAVKHSLTAKFGMLLAGRAMRKVRLRMDPRRYNGAMFLGLNGITVKSHGGTDAIGFANAIGVAVDLLQYGFSETIKAEIERVHVVNGAEPVQGEATGAEDTPSVGDAVAQKAVHS